MKTRLNDKTLLVLAILFCLAVFLMLHEFFSKDLSNLSVEILAAVLGTVVTVSCMAFMMRLQARQEKDREYSTRVFERKLEIYQQLLGTIFKMDDDGVITKAEIQDVENQVGVAALVAEIEVVGCLSQLVCQLKEYGCIYRRSMDSEQKRDFATRTRDRIRKGRAPDSEVWLTESERDLAQLPEDELDRVKDEDLLEARFVELDKVVQAMRDELEVIDHEDEDLEGLIDGFVRIPFDPHGLVRKPSTVD